MLRIVYTLLLLTAVATNVYGETSSRVIDSSEWTNNSGQIGEFDPIRASRVGDTWILKPGANTPHNSFGWIQGPTVTVAPSTDELQGNKAGFRIIFDVSTSIGGTSPELRLRMNSEDFGLYAIGAVTHTGFVETYPMGGVGFVEVEFDRSRIDEETDFFLFIDLLSYHPVGTVRENWEVRILSAEYYTTVSNSSFSRDDLFTLVYMEIDRDVYAHVGGSRTRVKLRSSSDSNAPASFCYDGAFAAVIEDGRLYAFTPLNGLNQTTVATNNIVYAGISDENLGYLDSEGRAYYYNIATGEKRNVDLSRPYSGVIGAGDGVLLFVRLRVDDTLEVYQYDTRLENPLLQRLSSDSGVIFINARTTDYAGEKKTSAEGWLLGGRLPAAY